MRIEFKGGVIIVEEVDPQADLSVLLTEEDHQHLATLNAPTRRAQWSSWRAIVRREIGGTATLRYNSVGAPLLTTPQGNISHLSVSHSAHYVAVMLADRRCGVDIEDVGRNFGRIASRYISAGERELFAERVGPHFEAIVWSAKEAIYKYAQATGVDFTQEMVITEFDPTEQWLVAELYGIRQPKLHYQFIDQQVVAYIADNQ